jgi:hypothetical protein
LKMDSSRVQQLRLSILPQSLRPFAFEPFAPLCIRALLLYTRAATITMTSLGQPDHFQSEAALNLVRGLLGWRAPVLAGRIHAGAVPLGDLTARDFVLFVSYISCGLALPISPFFLLLLEEFGLQLQHLTPHSILQAAIFIHLYEMFVGWPPALPSSAISSCWSNLGRLGTILVPTIFRRGWIRSCPTSPPSAVQGGRTGADWVIASVEANDRLVLPSNGPNLDRKLLRTQLLLSPELLPVLDRIETLATGGLTSMHVVDDFLKRQVMPLQRRSRLCCWFTGPNDIGRIQRRLGTDLSWEELELLVKGITGESFIPESLILP